MELVVVVVVVELVGWTRGRGARGRSRRRRRSAGGPVPKGREAARAAAAGPVGSRSCSATSDYAGGGKCNYHGGGDAPVCRSRSRPRSQRSARISPIDASHAAHHLFSLSVTPRLLQVYPRRARPAKSGADFRNAYHAGWSADERRPASGTAARRRCWWAAVGRPLQGVATVGVTPPTTPIVPPKTAYTEPFSWI